MNAQPPRIDKTTAQQKAFLEAVKARRERRKRNAEDNSFWLSVGSMGTVGWSVSVPTALGVLFGRWLDGRLDSGHVFMVFFMLVGLGVGCTMAWRLVSERF